MATPNKPDRTKIETGDQQSERVGRTHEPQISYGADGRVLNANDIGDRSEKEQEALVNAQRAATGNRRDDVEKALPSDTSDFSDEAKSTRH